MTGLERLELPLRTLTKPYSQGRKVRARWPWTRDLGAPWRTEPAGPVGRRPGSGRTYTQGSRPRRAGVWLRARWFLPGTIWPSLPTRELWAMSGDMCGGHTGWTCYGIWWAEARGTAKRPTGHRTAPTIEKCPVPNVSRAEAEKACLRPARRTLQVSRATAPWFANCWMSLP